MVSLWSKFGPQCKSRLSAIARNVFWGVPVGERSSRKHVKLWSNCAKLAQSEAGRVEVEQERMKLRQRVCELENQLAQPQPVTLPLGKPPRGLQFGAGLIALCVNLARQIGLRPTRRTWRSYSTGSVWR